MKIYKTAINLFEENLLFGFVVVETDILIDAGIEIKQVVNYLIRHA